VTGIFATLLVRWGETGSAAPYITLLAACLLNLVYLLLAWTGVRDRILAIVQISLDVLLVGALVYLTGIDRFFSFLYFAVVIASVVILGMRMAIGMASAASIVLSLISTVYFVALHPEGGWLLPFVDPHIVADYATRRAFVLPYLFFFALSLHVVALLAGRLTTEISRIHILNEEILQNMTGGVLAADRFGGIQFINAQAMRLLEIRESVVLRGRRIDETLPREVAVFLRRAMGGLERSAQEFTLNGHPVQITVSGLMDGSGALRGMVAILNDLSLRKQMENMTRLKEMSASMAHEIRNPLASIRGDAQELESIPFSMEEDRRLLQVVIRESDRLDEIISEFLDYASDRPIDMGLCDLSVVLRETILLLEAQRNRNVEIGLESPRTMMCRGSPDKLKQVFLNLGINALDACSQNVKISHVLFRCAPAPASPDEPRMGVQVEVIDDGCGVARENMARLFDPFFTTKARGVGMGLAIARKLVQANGGEITLESEDGRGATARVWFPL
jgi:signal transduction histidine kinase